MFKCYSLTDIRMVQNMPTLLARDQPVVAIVTRLYCEKLAVDAMIENKITYVRYKTEGKCRISTQMNRIHCNDTTPSNKKLFTHC